MEKVKSAKLATILICLLFALCSAHFYPIDILAAKKKVVNIGWTNSSNSLNPIDTAFAINSASNYPTELLYLPLVQLDNDMKYKYMLAESITTRDNRVFTVKLNGNVYWTDGVPVTADDVVFTVNTIANPEVGSSIAYLFNRLNGTDSKGLYPAGANAVSGVKKVDRRTIQFTTKAPIPLNMFNEFIGKNLKTFPKHVFQNIEPATLSTNPKIITPTITNGPFKLIRFQSGQYIRMGANKDYHLGSPRLDEINIVTLSSSSISAQLLSGEIDMNWPAIGNVPTSDYETLEKAANLNVRKGSPYAIQVLWINNKTIPDARVRRAISLAIDRDTIAKKLLKGYAEGLVIPFTSDGPFWNKDHVQRGPKIKEAKRLLDKAGWNSSKELRFRVPKGNVGRERASGIIVANLKKVGIKAKIIFADFPTTATVIKKDRAYDLGIMGISAAAVDPSPILSQIFTTGTAIGYSNSKMDQLITDVQTNVDSSQAPLTYKRIQKILLEDMPATCVYTELALIAINKRVTYGRPKEYGTFIDVHLWDVK